MLINWKRALFAIAILLGANVNLIAGKRPKSKTTQGTPYKHGQYSKKIALYLTDKNLTDAQKKKLEEYTQLYSSQPFEKIAKIFEYVVNNNLDDTKEKAFLMVVKDNPSMSFEEIFKSQAPSDKKSKLLVRLGVGIPATFIVIAGGYKLFKYVQQQALIYKNQSSEVEKEDEAQEKGA